MPGAEREASGGDGNGEAHAEERTFGMRWHVVESFHRVVVIGFALAYEAVHDFAHVCAHIGVGILVDGECARGVLHKEVEQSCLWQRLRQMLHNFARDEVAPAALGRELKGGLCNHFCGRFADERVGMIS